MCVCYICCIYIFPKVLLRIFFTPLALHPKLRLCHSIQHHTGWMIKNFFINFLIQHTFDFIHNNITLFLYKKIINWFYFIWNWLSLIIHTFATQNFFVYTIQQGYENITTQLVVKMLLYGRSISVGNSALNLENEKKNIYSNTHTHNYFVDVFFFVVCLDRK